ncbi:NmrA domain-containing protein [Mycena indigotica]|uniref:NmrA domain-containing protein n=1 Tax=Mycena indigotica TaxID=2126181 RepID=A0A8H6SIG1_9AGAR|nr:NmrA domain-containing protein [Mycena indigotica]KAF7299437.1 NmrA domain-containing protein [Mycena indigotica]
MTITKDDSAPLIAVVGATGLQGGSVVNALAESKLAYRIRAFTRNATKPAAEVLKAKGVEVVQVDLTVENKDQVFKAFVGTNYAFLVTNFWEHLNMEREVAEGKLLIDAAKAVGARGIVWSGLPSVSKASNGKYTHVVHFDGKAIVTEYGRQSGVPFVNVPAGLYAQNFFGPFGLILKRPDGTFEIAWNMRPGSKIPLIDIVKDYGLFVRKAIESELFPDGQDINTVSEDIAPTLIAEQLSEVTGKTVVYTHLTTEEWVKRLIGAGQPEAIAIELVQSFTFFDEIGYYAGQPSASTEGLGTPTQTWKQFARSADWSKVLI